MCMCVASCMLHKGQKNSGSLETMAEFFNPIIEDETNDLRIFCLCQYLKDRLKPASWKTKILEEISKFLVEIDRLRFPKWLGDICPTATSVRQPN